MAPVAAACCWASCARKELPGKGGKSCAAAGLSREEGCAGEALVDDNGEAAPIEALLLGTLARLGAFSNRRPSMAAGLLLAAISSSYELVAAAPSVC